MVMRTLRALASLSIPFAWSAPVSAQVFGDIDQDGTRDVIVRAPESGPDAISGSVQIYSGIDATLIGEIAAPVNHGLFGFDAVAVGDLTGDGVSEIAISAPGLVFDLDRLGAVFLYDGSDLSLISVATPEHDEMLLWDIAGTGDIDADETGDLLVRSLIVGTDRIIREQWILFSGSTGLRLESGMNVDTAWSLMAEPAELYSVPTPTEDVNGDQIVDFNDAIAVAGQLGDLVSPASGGDVVINGRIDQADFNQVVATMGQTITPIDGIVDEPLPYVDPDSLPSWTERAAGVVCILVPRPGFYGNHPFPGQNPVLREGAGGLVVWLVCFADGTNPCVPEPADFVYEREVFSDTQTYTIQASESVAWEIIYGENLLDSWSTSGHQNAGMTFSYTPKPNEEGRLIVRAAYADNCGEVREKNIVIDIFRCLHTTIVSDRWIIGQNEFQVITAELNPIIGGFPSWQIFSGQELLQNHFTVGNTLFIHSGATAGSVNIVVSQSSANGCATGSRIMLIAPQAGVDTDGDGASDVCENMFGSDPLDPLDLPNVPPTLDSDNDGLGDLQECELGTDPYFYDSDSDGIPDGDEVDNGTDPNNSDSDGDGIPDGDEDSDGDGLSDHDEIIFGSDPSNPDSDGDGVSDGDEVGHGSDPTDPSDGGVPPPPEEIVEVELRVGDHSGSHSEMWAMTVGPISLRAPGYGQVTPPRVFKFRKGKVYPISIQHLGSNIDPPDYDYTATVELVGNGCIKLKDTARILGVFGDVNGAPADEAQLYIPLIDIDIDSDNDDGYGTPSGSDIEDEIEGQEDLPGKVFLVSTLDTDRDGVPDFADGFDLLAQLPHDDTSAGSRLVPVIVYVGGLDADADQVRIAYDASDPLAVDITLAEPFTPAGGTLRLWRTPPEFPRNGQSVLDGGDFVAPGLYDPVDLGFDAEGSVIWYLEAVREAASPGDQTIEVELVPSPGEASYECAGPDAAPLDLVRVTPTRVELLARGFGEDEFDEAGGLIATTLDDPNVPDYEPPPPGMTAGSWLTYVLRVHDPRPGITQVTIDGQPLPLTPAAGGGYETPEFVCLPAIVPLGADLPPYPAVSPGPGDITWEYNPSWELAAKPEFERQPAYMRQLLREIDRAVEDLETSNWNGLTSIDGTTYSPNDAGAFGKEVHKRVALRLTGSRWMKDVWILESENRVIAIGGAQPPGYGSAQLTQVDIMRLKGGYTPQVGDILDPSRIDDIIDIKTSLNAEMTAGQRNRLRAVVGGRKIRVAVPVRRWTRGLSWHEHAVGRNMRMGLALVGGAGVAGLSSGFAIMQYAEHEEQFVNEIQPLINDFRNEQNDIFRATYAAEIVDKMGSYLGQFMLEDTIVNFVKLATIYKIFGED